MNERIKELWEQAVCGDGPHASVIADFAELIVKKCAEIGERYADGNYEVPNQILEYFGLGEKE